MACSFDMRAKRRNWTNAKWAVLELETPVDISEFQVVQRVGHHKKIRGDEGVYVAFPLGLETSVSKQHAGRDRGTGAPCAVWHRHHWMTV